MKGVEGLRVAVVGRAASLKGRGSAIDACDKVIRVNWMLPPQSDPRDVGGRTDLLYHCYICTPHRDRAIALGIPTVRVNSRVREAIAAASRIRGYLPTAGFVAIVDALDSGAKEVCAFGFDLYASGYTEASPTDTDPDPPGETRHHDFAEDRRLMALLLLTEPRFKPDPVLSAILDLQPLRVPA